MQQEAVSKDSPSHQWKAVMLSLLVSEAEEGLGCVTRAARFRTSDVTRAIRAAEKAGLSVGRIKIGTDGSIEVVAGEPEAHHGSDWFAGGPLYRDVA
jgi:hypothetical protein